MYQLVLLRGEECAFSAIAHIVCPDGEVIELPLEIEVNHGAQRLKFDLDPACAHLESIRSPCGVD